MHQSNALDPEEEHAKNATGAQPTADFDDCGLSVSEQTALQLVAAGRSHEVAGRAIGRSSKSVQRLLRRPEARTFVRSAQAERLDQVVGLLGLAPVDAAQVVLDELQASTSATRLRAAALVLGSFERLRAAAQQDTAIAQLHREIDQLQAELGGGTNE